MLKINNMMSIAKFLRGLAICAVVACPLAVSCDKYDDTDIREQLETLINKVYELEQKMNSEIQALKDLLDGSLLIKSAVTDAQTGVTTITLSNGAELTLLPEKDLKSFVTYIHSGGVDYWAYIDADGKKQYFLDKNNEAIPVMSETPEVITRDDETFLLIGGVEYPLSGNSVFSDYELIKDELSGDVYAVTFTFGEDMSFTVTVDGKAGFMFLQSDGVNSSVVSEIFIGNTLTGRVAVKAVGVVDYVLQIPDGWRVEEGEDSVIGKYFDITAPSKALVEDGIAAADGDLKVVAVLQGGKAMIAKLKLTSEPFKKFDVLLGNATVTKNNGLSKYVYGICAAADFDEAAIFAKAEEILPAQNYPAGYGVTSENMTEKPLTDIAADLAPGSEYVFWALPAFYDEDESSYYLTEGTFIRKTIVFTSATIKISDEAIRDAKLVFEMKGVASYYFGLSTQSDYDAAKVVTGLNTAGTYTAKTTPMTYSGSIFTYSGVTSTPATGYVAWWVVAEDGKKYTEEDIIVREFSTLNLSPGSEVKVVAGEVDAEPLDFTTRIEATGAESIYYTVLEEVKANAYKDDAARSAFLFEKGVKVTGTSADVKASDFLSKIAPETKYVLMAVATDPQGKYSEVLVKTCTTAAISFNEMVVNVSKVANTPDLVQLGISVTGGEAVDYLYWIGETSNNFWKSGNYLGGNLKNAEVYMYLNSSANRFAQIKENYPIEDGVITMTDHTQGVQYVIVIMAKDANGNYSAATELKFTPLTMDIGTLVEKTDPKWKAAYQALSVDFIPESFVSKAEFASYSYNVTLPANYTAYVVSGSDSWLNDNDDNGGVPVSAEEKIIRIIQVADHSRDTERVEDLDGDGKRETDVYYTFEHGDATAGYAVIWADETYHDANCTSSKCNGNWDDPEGSRYGNKGTVHHVVYYNTGKPVKFTYPYAAGDTEKVVDRVFIVLQDLDGNCYELFEYDVPVEYFQNAK